MDKLSWVELAMSYYMRLVTANGDAELWSYKKTRSKHDLMIHGRWI